MSILPFFARRHGALAAALLGLAAAPAAWADFARGDVTALNPLTIEIASNGSAYTVPVIPLVSLTATVGIVVDTGKVGTVKSWTVRPTLVPRAPGMPTDTTFPQHTVSEQYPVGSRPHSVSTSRQLSIPYGTLATYLPAQCNHMANGLRAQGVGNAQIFAQDRGISVTVSVAVLADTTGAGQGKISNEVGLMRDFTIVCKAHAVHTNPAMNPAGGLQAASEARLTAITASVLHAQHPASCPAEVTARVVFTSNTPGSFTWEFRSSATHRVSAPVRLEMGPGDKQGANYVKVYDQKFVVGAPPPSGGGGGQASGTAAGKGGLAAVQVPDGQPGGGGGASQQQVGGGYASAPSNTFQDSLRAVVLNAAQGSVQQSGLAAYLVHCPPPQATPAHQAAGTFQSQRPNQEAPAASAAVLATPSAGPTRPALPLPAATPALPTARPMPPTVPVRPAPAAPQREPARR